MVLNLSLGRIGPLLAQLASIQRISWPKVVHIAGTNGKGSTSAYVSHILVSSRVKTGRFNSPHLVEARDSIQIDNCPVDKVCYELATREVEDINDKYGFQCTEFELLTATALNCFAKHQCQVAVLEVGVGGREDATNALGTESIAVTAITKVGLDHQGLLGNTLREIAHQKVGIFKHGVTAVIDGSNDPEVLEVAHTEAKIVGCPLLVSSRDQIPLGISPKLLGDYQYDNLALALKVIEVLKRDTSLNITTKSIKLGVESTVWPGRLQMVSVPIENSTNELQILLDGAHNPQAAVQLRLYLDTVRPKNGFIFIMGFSKGKDIKPILRTLLSPEDTVITLQFTTPVEGMPWVESIEAVELKAAVEECGFHAISSENLTNALQIAYDESESKDKKVVICGSLYLVADVIRLKAFK